MDEDSVLKLYICGNGFDIHHSLSTRYLDYRDFLSKTYPQLVKEYESFSHLGKYDSQWKDVEMSLNIDYDELLYESIESFYPDVASNSDAIWTDIDIDIELKTEFFSMFTGECFFEWLSKLDYSNAIPDENIRFTPGDLYINFNYTNSIQRLYGIPDSRVLHIHGSLDQLDCDFLTNHDIVSSKTPNFSEVTNPIVRRDKHNSDMIRSIIQFGATGISPKEVHEKLVNKYQNEDFFGVSIEPAINRLDDVINITTKNIRQNFDRLRKFVSFAKIDEVIIMGHSLGESDTPYYQEILVPLFSNCSWSAMVYGGMNGKNAQQIISFGKQAEIDINLHEW